MKVALVILMLVVLLPLAYFAMKFAEAQNDCKQGVVEAATAVYPEPGAGARQKQAIEAAMNTPACVRTATFSHFVLTTFSRN